MFKICPLVMGEKKIPFNPSNKIRFATNYTNWTLLPFSSIISSKLHRSFRATSQEISNMGCMRVQRRCTVAPNYTSRRLSSSSSPPPVCQRCLIAAYCTQQIKVLVFFLLLRIVMLSVQTCYITSWHTFSPSAF